MVRSNIQYVVLLATLIARSAPACTQGALAHMTCAGYRAQSPLRVSAASAHDGASPQVGRLVQAPTGPPTFVKQRAAGAAS